MKKEIKQGGIYFLDENTSSVNISNNIKVVIVDLIKGVSFDKEVFVGKNTQVEYKLGAYKNVEFDATFNFHGESSNTNIECLFLSKNPESIKGNVNVNIKNKNVHVETNITGLIGDKGNVDISGNIYVDKKLHNIKGNLHQHCIYVDNSGQARVVPKLEVYSNDVDASHGAKTEKVDENSLFYFTSKGISFEDSEKLLITSYISNFLDNFEDKENIQQNFLDYVL